MSRLFVSVCCLLALSGLVHAAPPLLISDTGTPGDRQWEINVGLTLERTLAHFQVTVPNLNLNYGIGDSLQLKYEVPWIFSKAEGEETKNGVGNSVLGVKWRFRDETPQGIALSFYPQVEFNTVSSSVDKGLVDKGTKWILPFEMEKMIGPINVIGELGYIFNPEKENQWLYALAFGYQSSKDLEWVGECYGIASSNLEWIGHDLVFNLGVRWKPISWLKLNVSAGRSLHSAYGNEKTLISYMGMQFLF